MNMNIFKCPECNGKGVVWDHSEGIMTCGIGYLFQAACGRKRCPRCGGRGFIKVE